MYVYILSFDAYDYFELWLILIIEDNIFFQNFQNSQKNYLFMPQSLQSYQLYYEFDEILELLFSYLKKSLL